MPVACRHPAADGLPDRKMQLIGHAEKSRWSCSAIHEALNIALTNHDKKEEARIYWVLVIYYGELARYC